MSASSAAIMTFALLVIDEDAIGDLKLLLIGGKREAPWPLADQHIIEDFTAGDVDHRHMIGAAEGHIGARSVLGDDEVDRRHHFLAHALGEELYRRRDFEARKI